MKKGFAMDEIFLITQYFVNSYQTGIDPYLVKIKNGASYEIKNGKLKIEGKEFNAPLGWDDREDYWEKAEKELCDEK